MQIGWIGAGVAVLGLAGAAAGGCGGDDPPPSPFVTIAITQAPAPCAPGQQTACACPGGTLAGVQLCNAEGSAWGACTGCPAPTTSSTTSSGTGGSGSGGTGGHGGEGGAGGQGGAPCQPKANPCAGVACGSADDGCGAQVACPAHCQVGDVCVSSACCTPTVKNCDGRCGPQDDGCGGLSCDGVCGDGVWLTCDAAAGRCACQDAAGYPNALAAKDTCTNTYPGTKPYYCPKSTNEANYQSDIPSGCTLHALGNIQPADALLYCCTN